MLPSFAPLALVVVLAPTVIDAEPRQDDLGAASEVMRRELGEDALHWTLSLIPQDERPGDFRVVVVSDRGDEKERLVRLGQTPPQQRAAVVAEVAVGLIRAVEAERAKADALRRKLEAQRARKLEEQRRLERERQQALTLSTKSKPDSPLRGFVAVASRTSFGGRRGLVESAWGVRAGLWVANDHLMPVMQGGFTFGGHGDYLKQYGGRVGAGLFAGAPLAKGFLWVGGGVTPHLRWDRSAQAPVQHPTGFDTEISGIMQSRGSGHLALRLGIELAPPRTIVEYGDAGVDRGVVRFLTGVTIGLGLPVRRKR